MKIIKVNFLTIYFLFILFLCGYLKIGLCIFLIILIHELGHVFFIKILKYKVKKIEIFPFGGITKIEKDINTSTNKEILIASGGIIFQLILLSVIKYLPISAYTENILLKYNMSIIFFNILPIIPLDGSVILNSILNKFFSYKKSYYIYLTISIVGIVLYIFSNYYYSLNNYLIVGLLIVKTYYAYKNYHYLFNRFLLERYLNKYEFKYLNTKEGNLDILKIDTYQYFKENNKVVSEKQKLGKLFDKL